MSEVTIQKVCIDPAPEFTKASYWTLCFVDVLGDGYMWDHTFDTEAEVQAKADEMGLAVGVKLTPALGAWEHYPGVGLEELGEPPVVEKLWDIRWHDATSGLIGNLVRRCDEEEAVKFASRVLFYNDVKTVVIWDGMKQAYRFIKEPQ